MYSKLKKQAIPLSATYMTLFYLSQTGFYQH